MKEIRHWEVGSFRRMKGRLCTGLSQFWREAASDTLCLSVSPLISSSGFLHSLWFFASLL
jgi:hypothetical protein